MCEFQSQGYHGGARGNVLKNRYHAYSSSFRPFPNSNSLFLTWKAKQSASCHRMFMFILQPFKVFKSIRVVRDIIVPHSTGYASSLKP